MNQGLACKRSYLAVIGCIMKDYSLLDDLQRPLTREDFNTEPFYELLFVAISNLYIQGCRLIDEFAVDSYLSGHTKQYDIFKINDGLEYLKSAREIASLENYDYFYHRLKKYTLLRYYEQKGYDTSRIVNFMLTDPSEIEKEQQKFEDLTEERIIDQVETDLVLSPKMNFCSDSITTDVQAGQGLNELIEEYQQVPDIGIPLSSVALNTVSRGARLKKLYMRSSNQGGGKSRLAAADACCFSIPWYWDTRKNEWHYTGISEPTLYITTEMEVAEIQTLFLAYVSGVDERHILYGTYAPGEIQRIQQASIYIRSSPLYLCHIPDFSIEDITNIIKKYKREKGVNYICFDYIHSSLKLMSEIGNASHSRGLREDQMLLFFSDKLKSLCNQLDVFIFTASQLNGEYDNATVKDQRLLRGSKALADKLDMGCIVLEPSRAEKEKIKPILAKMVGIPEPNRATWIYKCRRGHLVRVILWQYVDLGTCRTQDLFVTDFEFKLIDVDFTVIENVEKVVQENSIPMHEVPDDEPETKDDYDW